MDERVKINTEKYIDMAKKAHGNKFDYSLVTYSGYKGKIKIKCNNCGGIFENRADYHLVCVGCKYCHERVSTNDYIEKAIKVHGDNFDYSLVVYKKAKDVIKIKCQKCGTIFSQKAYAHLDGRGCKKCNIIRQLSNKKKFAEESTKIHGDNFDYSLVDYKTNKIKVKLICKKHNHIFEQSPNSHLRGQGCPLCKESRGERNITNFLIENNIKYEKNHIFEKCRYKNPLHFDFYLPNNNMCIEFDGIQHFHFRYGDNENENLQIRQIRDSIKNEYCKNNNIQLIRIKYTENINDKLNHIFNDLEMKILIVKTL